MIRATQVWRFSLIETGESKTRHRRTWKARARRSRGIAMIIVLAAVAVVFVLASGFLASQGTTIGIAQNGTRLPAAGYLAESGVAMVLAEIQADPDWRTNHAAGTWMTDYAYGDGTISVRVDDGIETTPGVFSGSGDLADDPEESFTITATGKVAGVTRIARAAVNVVAVGESGLFAEYFVNDGTTWNSLSNVDFDAEPDHTEVVPQINWARQRSESPWEGGSIYRWAGRYTGQIDIPAEGSWTFFVESDDGAALWIDGSKVVDNDGKHSMRNRDGTVALTAGLHDIEIQFFQWDGDYGLIASWQGPGVATKTVIPSSRLVPATQSGGGAGIGLNIQNFINIWGQGSGSQCLIDTYSPAAGSYGGTNTGGGAVVSLNSAAASTFKIQAATIFGEARTLGDPASVITYYSKSSITDGASQLSAAVTMPAVTDPGGWPASSGYLSLWGSNVLTWSTNMLYSGASISNSAVINVTAPVKVRFDGQVGFSSDATINIQTGGSLEIYMNGNLGFYNNAKVNIAGDPSKVKIYFLGNDRSIQLSDNAQLCAEVYNPNGSMSMWGNSNPGSQLFGGAYIKQMDMGDKAQIHLSTTSGGDAASEPTPTTNSYHVTWQY